MKPAIFAIEGTQLTDREREFFQDVNPFGFILFERNCESLEQIEMLTSDLRKTVGRVDLPILIDEEGGRVSRLKKTEFKPFPAPSIFFDIARRDLSKAQMAVYLNYYLMAIELKKLGLTVNCAPVADIIYPISNKVLHDRCFGNNSDLVAILAKECAKGLIDGGIYPIIKHIPGHGRANVDSHESLPIVEETLATLERTDFAVFKSLKHLPFAMTAHIVYTAIDKDKPATISPEVISYIRKKLEFEGIIMTDDLSMKALKGSLSDLAQQSLESGCDIVLHCNGKLAEMEEIADAIPDFINHKLAKFLKHFNLANNRTNHESLAEKYAKIMNEHEQIRLQALQEKDEETDSCHLIS